MAPVAPLLARLTSEPLAMCRARGGALLRALAAAGALTAADLPPAPASAPGVVSVRGVLVRRGLGLGPEVDAICGLAPYESIVAQVRAAAADSSVASIVLDVDSPGGEVQGLLDAADAIRAARTVKPIVAVANENALSAAYVLAAAASRVVVPRTGYLGSVGVVVAHEDLSGALAQAGVRVTLLHAGAKKADGDPSQPLSPAAAADVQARVDAAWTMLAESVASSRKGLTVAGIKALEAGVFRGQDAVAAGLADEVGTLSSVIDGLKNQQSKTGTRSSPFGARAPWPKHARAHA